MQEFDSSVYSPATVFTLCDLPNKDGYGVGSTSGAKLGSHILQIFAKAILVNKGIIQLSEYDDRMGVLYNFLEMCLTTGIIVITSS